MADEIQKLIELLPEAYIIMAGTGEIVNTNPIARAMLGYKQKALIGKHIRDMVLEHDGQITRHLLSCQEAGKSVLGGLHWNTASGTILEAHCSSYCIHQKSEDTPALIVMRCNPMGNVADIESLPIDKSELLKKEIMERKRAEERFRKSEEKFSKVFMSAPTAMAVSRLEDGLIFDVNEEHIRVFGYSREEVLGHTAIEFNMWVDHKDREFVVQQVKTNGSLRDAEFQVRIKNGEIKTIQYYADMIDVDGQICVLSAFRDITAIQRANIALKESEEKYSKVFMSNPAAISLSRLDDGQLFEVNDEYLRIFGFTREEVIGRTSEQIGLWVDIKDRTDVVQIILREGTARDIEVRMCSKIGEVMLFRYFGEKIIIQGSAYLISAFINITEGKKAETIECYS